MAVNNYQWVPRMKIHEDSCVLEQVDFKLIKQWHEVHDSVSHVQTARQAASMPQSLSSREVQYKIFTKEGTHMEHFVSEPRHPP